MNTEQLYPYFKECKKVSTDSRNIDEGCLFFALKGPSFDGNRYAADALEKGAAYAVIDNPEYLYNDKYLLVNDGLEALQKLANYHRLQLDIPIIGIAGSNGKTTTKELLKEVLSTTYHTFATPGNYNNEIGVPLSILQLTFNTEIAVLELGARHMGDIAELCEIAAPNFGIITNTGKDHLETFGTVEQTLKANAELFDYLQGNGGTAFVNVADAALMQVSEALDQRITYGAQSTATVRGRIEGLFPYLKVAVTGEEDWEIQSQLIGKYNFMNIMAAVAIGQYFKVPDKLIKRAIEAYAPKNNRSQLIERGSNIMLMDAYNANPSSMEEALNNLDEIEAENKVAILGDMLELGEYSHEEHLLMVLKLKKMKLKEVVLVGQEFGKVADRLDCHHFNTSDEAKTWFEAQNFENCTILFKGSRGIALEKIIN